MSNDIVWPLKPPTSLSVGPGKTILAFDNTLADAPWDASVGKEGVFASLWAPTPDVQHDVSKLTLKTYMPLAIQGESRRWTVVFDSASLAWLNGRSVGYEPERTADGRVRIARIFVGETTAAERAAAFAEQARRAAAANVRIDDAYIDLPFDEFLHRYLNEPGRVKIDAKFVRRQQ